MRDRPPFSCALIHSPLVGPRSWGRVADALRDRHIPAVVPSLLGARSMSHDAFADAAALGTGPWLLVVHSGAGALVPSLVERFACVGVLFVDALLPHPGRSWTAGAPADLVAALRGLVDRDGLLPPWHTWFGPDALTGLVPDDTLRAHVVADVPRVPLAYLEAEAPLHRRWEALPCGYLRLSESYLDEEREAASRGWATAAMAGHHLSAVTDPEAVAGAALDLARRVLGR